MKTLLRMNRIELRHILPDVFVGREDSHSDIWQQLVVFEKGKSYLIEAASGTGKSSLCSYIFGYRKDYQGMISFDQLDIRNFTVDQWVGIRQHNIGMLFQELRLFPELTAGENVLLKNKLTGYRSMEELKNLFEALGISDKWNQPVGKMSFGQQQRVAFVRMLCQPADFYFLDEPVSHLDDANGNAMAKILKEEIASKGCGVIVTSIGQRLDMDYTSTLKL